MDYTAPLVKLVVHLFDFKVKQVGLMDMHTNFYACEAA